MFNLRNIFILLILFFPLDALNAEIRVKFKVGDEIVTNIDISNEKKYLLFLRPDLSNLKEKEIISLAEKSIIKEIIKKKELKRIFKDNNPKIDEQVKKSLFKFKKVKNEKEFINLAEKNNIKYDKVIEKIKYEGLWNDLIFQKYSPLIKIDKTKLRKELISKISNDKKYEYNLSEILFEINTKEKLESKYKDILDYINLNNFKTAVTKYSISNSANFNGEIGWVKETILSNKLNMILENMKIKDVSKPIKFPNGYLILKVNDKREIKQKINIDKEFNELVSYEKSKQLNQFSLLFYKKLKQNTIVNEY